MTTNKPAHEVKVGRIRATIWANDTKTGRRFSVQVAARYKTGEDWKTSSSFFPEDLPGVLDALEQARAWIATQVAA